MRKFALILGLAVVLVASAAYADHITITLVGPAGPVAVDSFFDVFVEVDTDLDIAMVQAVLDLPDPSIQLTGVTAPLASLSFINPPDTAVADFFPNTHTGVFTAMTLTFKATMAGEFPMNLFVQTGSTFSTVVFDETYNPEWAIIANGDVVTVGVTEIPEPVTMGLMALVSLGGIVASRKK
jgi:hypothetical protein